MRFTPHRNQIEIIPIKKPEGPLLDEDGQYKAEGEVVAVGHLVIDYKKGDIITFRDWAMVQTPERDGVSHFLVPDSDEIMLGGYVAEEPV